MVGVFLCFVYAVCCLSMGVVFCLLSGMGCLLFLFVVCVLFTKACLLRVVLLAYVGSGLLLSLRVARWSLFVVSRLLLGG